MPLPKQLGPAQPRVDAGHSETKPSEGELKREPARRPGLVDKSKTPGAGSLPDDPQGNETDPGTG